MVFEKYAGECMELIGTVMRYPVHKGSAELFQGEGGILMYLFLKNDGVTAGELKDALGVGSSRIANALRTLEEKGMIDRKSSEFDRRCVCVFITDKGREYVDIQRREMLMRTRELLEELGEEDTEELLRILRKMCRIGKRNLKGEIE